ncbi:hypothetical protein GCM10010376_57660 [Streptomyces violaceusniger]
MLRWRYAQPRLRHKRAERQGHRELIPSPVQDRLHLVQHHIQGSVILHEMVELQHPTPAFTVRFGRDTHPQQRTPADIHRRTARGQQLLNHIGGPAVQGDLLNREPGFAEYHLDRLPQAFPQEYRPECVMPIHDRLESVHVPVQKGPGLELQNDGHDICVVAAVPHEVVEEDAFLQRSQRIHVRHVRRPTGYLLDDPFNLRAGQIDERQHVRRDRLCPLRNHVRRDRDLGLTGHHGQAGHCRRGEQRLHVNCQTSLPQSFNQRHREQ